MADYNSRHTGAEIDNTLDVVTNNSSIWTSKQDALVSSGENQNIKTINSESILGSGDITLVKDVKVDGTSVVSDKEANINLSGKVDKEEGKGLSTNDFTDAYKANVETNNSKVSNVQADWNATEGLAVILNKPTELGKVDDVKVDGASVVTDKIANIDLTGKQETLVSGTNIKTVNGVSILGSGNIDVAGGEGNVNDVKVDGTSVVTDKVANIDLSKKQDKTDSSLETSSKVVVEAVNEVNSKLSEETTNRKSADETLQSYIDLKQSASDSSLETSSKTIVGAINEVNKKPTIYYGTNEPSSSIGKDGDIYVKYSV